MHVPHPSRSIRCNLVVFVIMVFQIYVYRFNQIDTYLKNSLQILVHLIHIGYLNMMIIHLKLVVIMQLYERGELYQQKKNIRGALDYEN
jgi:hypothetical protein